MLTDAEVNANYSALLSGSYWSIPKDVTTLGRSAFVTYSFSQSANARSIADGYSSSFSAVNEGEKVAIRQALAQWSSVSGVKFLEVQQNTGDVEFGFYDFKQVSGVGSNTVAFASYPTSAAYFSTNQQRVVNYANPTSASTGVALDTTYRASSSYDSSLTYTLLHEIGHAIGLKHPFEGSVQLPGHLDNGANTVLSYTNPQPPSLGQLDIRAAQEVYGTSGNFGSHLASWNWNAATETLTQVGTAATEFLRGTQANDIINTGGGSDTISLGAGNDKVIADGNQIDVNGGDGFDTVTTTATYLGDSKDFGNAGFYTVYIDNALQTKQTYQNVERIEFSNGTIAFDKTGNAGVAYRMYKAAFDRTPDTTGLSYWIKALDANQVNISSMAANFVASNEFVQTYGSANTVTNLNFLTLLYKNVLDRTPDSSGQTYWLNLLDNNLISRNNTLANFSESTENIANVDNAITGGIWFV